MKFSELRRKLERDGWYIKRTTGHHIYVHPSKPGEIPVGKHGSKEVPTGTVNKILKQAGLK
jgi:predicted RNA binding protein YcfA (HicA-like mRNA interferase family)